MTNDRPVDLSPEEFNSLREVGNGDAQREIPQLVGWLEGLFHGIQTALFAQQMAARAQLEQMRQGALPPGMSPPSGQRGGHGTGQYL